MSFDPIDRPAHYAAGRKYEPIDVISDWQLNYRLGNALKYISRAGRKDPAKTIEDLKKAAWYINREISELQQSSPYAVSYQDVLEDHAACQFPQENLDSLYEYDWDPTLGPVEPYDPVPRVRRSRAIEDYCGQAEF